MSLSACLFGCMYVCVSKDMFLAKKRKKYHANLAINPPTILKQIFLVEGWLVVVVVVVYTAPE